MNHPDGRRGRPLARKTPPTDSAAVSVTPTAQDWRQNAQTVLSVLAGARHPFTCDTLTQLAGYPPRPQQLGAIFAAGKQQRLIEVVGAAIAENRLVRVWRGVS